MNRLKKVKKAKTAALTAALLFTCTAVITPVTDIQAEELNGMITKDGNEYWYENGILQGLEGRGKEIYDPASEAWYWLDSVQGGAVAKSKDVYQESWAGAYGDNGKYGKWVRYDENGHMIKGWDTNEDGKYYFEPITGAMAKGTVSIDNTSYRFDDVTGILLDKVFVNDNGCEYWYEGGIRQGLEGRGKEIYDPETDAWYWLDSIDNGKKATSKDVYQESSGGKWVRYDENGKMIKGWDTNENGTYYFDLVTGAMAKGTVFVDDYEYVFNGTTGILEGATGVHMQTKYIYYHNMDGSLYTTDSITYRAYEDGTPVEETLYDGSRKPLIPKDDDPNKFIMCWLVNVPSGPVVDNIEHMFGNYLNVADYTGDIHMYPGYLGGN